ncbi:hypothetical protein [Bradyrhizobium sp. CCBAU 45321]|uniref:hypothetical protein n=1 Tax=Bradyrhizobium sp. CCBAU 45321 TaxID=1641878 RepID=UPI0023047905|nr:hypothetical protein [Bradyrhizobium sp. CCBAU 45321]
MAVLLDSERQRNNDGHHCGELEEDSPGHGVMMATTVAVSAVRRRPIWSEMRPNTSSAARLPIT